MADIKILTKIEVIVYNETRSLATGIQKNSFRVIVRIMFRFNHPDTMNLIRWLPDVDRF